MTNVTKNKTVLTTVFRQWDFISSTKRKMSHVVRMFTAEVSTYYYHFSICFVMAAGQSCHLLSVCLSLNRRDVVAAYFCPVCQMSLTNEKSDSSSVSGGENTNWRKMEGGLDMRTDSWTDVPSVFEGLSSSQQPLAPAALTSGREDIKSIKTHNS